MKQTQNKWREADLSEKSTGKVLNKVFKVVVNELMNELNDLVDSRSEVSHSIP